MTKPTVNSKPPCASSEQSSATQTFADLARQRLEITYMLAEATRLSRAAFDNRVRAIGLTGASARALFSLGKEDGLSQIELARRLDVSRMALGQTIDRLEKSGHVERRPDPSDRRVWRLHLTKAAHDLLPQLAEFAIDQQALVLENIPEEEIEALKQSLRKITERLRSMPIQLFTDDDPVVERDPQ